MLTIADFSDFFLAVHGRRPFAWQRDLTETIVHDRAWPDLVDIPTGLGKTALIDISVFIAALSAAETGTGRLGRRRTFLVVDRRIVVDQAHEHARALASALDTAETRAQEGHPLTMVAAALRSLAPDTTPGAPVLPVTRMRGGTTWAASWLDRPDLPAVITGTVDQIGSRFLFRGYGVSDNRKPLDAALVGTDSLLLIDEAHLAEAMITTIGAAHQRDSNGLNLPPARVVLLTATPPKTSGPPKTSDSPKTSGLPRTSGSSEAASAETATGGPRSYRLDARAHERDPDPTAWRRLTAHKRLHLVQADQAGTNTVIATLAVRHAGEPGRDTVLVVCNTVNRARAVHDLILKQVPGASGPGTDSPTVSLLIGRSRPVDREHVVADVIGRFGAGGQQDIPRRPAILVATQTVEVGADLDATTLISESASWDALIQRFGRLNRFGDHLHGGRAIIVHDGVADGPVYGLSRDEAWSYLLEREPVTLATKTSIPDVSGSGVDIGPLACRALSANAPSTAIADRAPAAVLTRTQLDAWVCTGPVPLNDPPLEAYLHGLRAASPAVSVLWRDGLSTDAMNPVWMDDAEDDEETPASAASVILSAVPPRADEQVEVPLITARRWMSGEAPGVVSDLDYSADTEQTARRVSDPFRALVRRPSDRLSDASTTQWRWVEAEQIRPGDVLVVPTLRGGLDEFGWAPASRATVLDVSEVAALHRGLPVLRLDQQLPWRLGLSSDAAIRLRDRFADLRRSVSEDAGNGGTDEASDECVSALIARLIRDAHPDTASTTGSDAADRLERIEGLTWTPHSLSTLLGWLDTGPTVTTLNAPQEQHRTGEPQFILTGPLPRSASPSTGVGCTGTAAADGIERDDDSVAGTSTSRASTVSLTQHHRNVGHRAAQIARALGLDEATTTVVQDAARWHDLGKVETRFQTMLHGGDRLLADLATEPLAKSGIPPSDPLRWRAARQRSGLPAGARHEAWSSALVQEYLDTPNTDYPGDRDLLLHLIASHHGRARPLLPAIVDTQPTQINAEVDGLPVTVSSSRVLSLEHPTRFEHLNARYGRWGLALLESIVRCADMTVSGEGS